MKKLKACKHYKLTGIYDTFVIPISGYPWSAFLEDDLVQVYKTAFYGDYLIHLRDSPNCREEIGVDLKEINSMIEVIKQEVSRDGKVKN